MDVRCRRVKHIVLLRRRFWAGDVTALAAMTEILRTELQLANEG